MRKTFLLGSITREKMRQPDTWRTCYRCSYETEQPLALCPNCGYRLRTERQVRRLGWVLVGIGASLVLGMGVLSFLMVRIMTGQTEDRFTGGTAEAMFIFGVVYLVAMLGGVGIVAGIWQIRHGRRNPKLTMLVLGLGVMFFVLGLLVRLFG